MNPLWFVRAVVLAAILAALCWFSPQFRPASVATPVVRDTADVWHTVASWYAKPGDRWSRRYPAAYYHGWPFRVGEFTAGVAFNSLPLFSVVRVTCEATGRSILAVVVDRIGSENPRDVRKRIDLTWAAFRQLADPKQGLVHVEVVEAR